MIQTVTIRAQRPWMHEDISLFHGEPLCLEIQDRPSDHQIIFTVGPDSAAFPVIEVVGTDQIDLTAQDLAPVPEGATYFYNVWGRVSGQQTLLQRGQFFVRKSVAPLVPPLLFSSGVVPEAEVGTPYVFAPAVSGGVAPYTFDLVIGELPTGLSLSAATGAISGLPVIAGTFAGIVVRATDDTGNSALLPAFDIHVAPPQPITVTADAPLLLIDGDSIMDYNATRLVLEHYIGHQYRKPLDYNQARAGDTTQQILDGTQGVLDQIETGRTIVLVGPTGANQSAGSNTFAEISAQQQQIYDSYLSAGAIVVAVPTLPETDEFGGLEEKDALLAWVGAHQTGGTVLYDGTSYDVTARANFYAVDIGTPDRTQTGSAAYGPSDFNPYTMKNDQTHPNGEGSRYLAEKIAAVLGGLVTSDVFSAIPSNLLGANAGFAGSVAATRPGIVGTVPTGWDVSRSGGETTWSCSKDANDHLVASVVGAGNNSVLSVAIEVDVNGNVDDVFDMVIEAEVAGSENGFRGLRIIAETGTDQQGDASFYPGRSTLTLRSVSVPSAASEVTKTFTIQVLVETGATVAVTFKRALVFPVSTSAVPLAVSGLPSTTAQVDNAYSFVPAVTGGTPPYAFDLASGTLPSGVGLDVSVGTIAGTPAAAGTFSGIVLRVTDDLGQTALLPSFDLEVLPQDVPQNAALPSLSTNTPNEGQEVLVTTGTWTNNASAFEYRWLLDGTVVAGATLDAFTPLIGSAGQVLTAEVRAQNGGGWSNWTSTLASAPIAPQSGDAPVPWDTAIASGEDLVFSDGDRTITNTHATNNRHCRGTQPISGKIYFEIATTLEVRGVGVGDETMTALQTKTLGVNCAYWTGTGVLNGSTNNVGGSYSAGDVVQVAVDRDANLLWVRKNGVGDWNGNSAESPETGAGGIDIAGLTSTTIFPMVSLKPGGIATLQGSPDRVAYTVPAGFSTLP